MQHEAYPLCFFAPSCLCGKLNWGYIAGDTNFHFENYNITYQKFMYGTTVALRNNSVQPCAGDSVVRLLFKKTRNCYVET